jgi:hypothetical protein
VGADTLLTPGEVVRDFIGVLNILQQNPQLTLNQVVHSSTFQPSKAHKDASIDETSEFAEFTV